MVFVVGWGSKMKEIGDGPPIECPHCHNTRQWRVGKTSKQIDLYWVPVAKWSVKYILACPVCDHGVELEGKDQAYRLVAAAYRMDQALQVEVMRLIEA